LPIPYNLANQKHKGVGPIAFARAWLADNNYRPDDLSFFAAPDDLMQPNYQRTRWP
jgi:hypothetical protein